MMQSHCRTEWLWKIALVLICVGICPLSSDSQTSVPAVSQSHTLWSTAAKRLGYEGLLEDFNFTVGYDVVKVQFLDDQQLALAWITPDQPTKPAGRVIHVPSHLHLKVLDAQTGHELSSHEWPCTSFGVNLAHTEKGQWVVANEESVALYSSTFDKVNELQNIHVSQSEFLSPSGRTFLTFSSDSQGKPLYQLRDSATFGVLDSWGNAQVAKASFVYSDHFILAHVAGKPPQFFIREMGKNWNSFVQPPAGTYPMYTFLDDDTLLRLFWGDQLIVETITGKELFSQTVRNTDLFSRSPLATSRGTDRFALIFQRMKGVENELIDLRYLADGRVIVFSVPQKRVISTVKAYGRSPLDWTFHYAWNRIALSPNGLLLAVISDKEAQVYALPSD